MSNLFRSSPDTAFGTGLKRPEIGTGETTLIMYESNNTALMTDVEQLYQQYEEVKQYDDLNETEQEALRTIETGLDDLYESARTREALAEIRWDRISENAEDMVGEINNTVGLPNDFSSSDVPDNQYRNMVESIEREVDSIQESLIQIEEIAGELAEHSQ